MSRKLTLAATALVLAAASPAFGQEAATAPTPASAEQRAAYERADPLARSVFWAREADLNPSDPVAGVRLAEALREMGRHDQAVEAAQNVLMVQPGNVEAMLEVGRAHIARGQAFYGVAALEQARDAAPNDWRPLSLLGVAYQQVRRPADAQTAWTAALALSPENPNVLSNMAMVASGDSASAEPLLRRAAAHPDATLQMRQNLALVLGLNGNRTEAEQILRRHLPPEQADRNLQWLGEQVGSASPAPAPRTWESLSGR